MTFSKNLFKFSKTLDSAATFENFQNLPCLRVFFELIQFKRHQNDFVVEKKLPETRTSIFHNFPRLIIKFHDFPGQENEILEFHDFPGLDKSLGQTENGLERGFTKHGLNSSLRSKRFRLVSEQKKTSPLFYSPHFSCSL